MQHRISDLSLVWPPPLLQLIHHLNLHCSVEQQEQPPPPKKKCEDIPSTEQDNNPCIIIVYNDDATIFQVCGLNGSVIQTTDAANNPLAPQAVADNLKAWVAVVVIREGGVPVTEKYPVGGGGHKYIGDSTIK